MDVLAALDPEQRQAAEALTGPVCILAGAGTGKDAHRARDRLGRLPLLGVERAENVHCAILASEESG